MLKSKRWYYLYAWTHWHYYCSVPQSNITFWFLLFSCMMWCIFLKLIPKLAIEINDHACVSKWAYACCMLSGWSALEAVLCCMFVCASESEEFQLGMKLTANIKKKSNSGCEVVWLTQWRRRRWHPVDLYWRVSYCSTLHFELGTHSSNKCCSSWRPSETKWER